MRSDRRGKAVRRLASLFCGRLAMLVRIETEHSAVALTFDDGPDPETTPVLLDLLAAAHARATFFLDGPASEQHPALVSRITDEGHAIGNHGWSHASAIHEASASGFRAQFREIRRAERAIGRRTTMYRPPYGHESRWTRLVALMTGHRVVGWSAAAGDWSGSASEQLTERVRSAVAPGAIVLLHDSLRTAASPGDFDRSALLASMRVVLEERADDVKFLTVPELLRCGRPVLRWRRTRAAALPSMLDRSAAP